MKRALSWGLVAALVAAAFVAVPSYPQRKEYEPQVGQAGKDVIWVPTPEDVVDRMLRMAQTTANDYVIDLGAGDGRIVIAAAKKIGARALGIEYNSNMVKHAQGNVEKAGVADKARVIEGDIFVSDFSQATVLTMYLMPELNLKLRPQILTMRPATRVVSHSFSMEDWEPDEVSVIDGRTAYLWIVPANVTGNWSMELTGAGNPQRLDVTFEQRYQKISGTVVLGPVRAGLREPWLRGFQITFSYVDNNGVRRDLSGRVVSGRMEGSFRADNGQEGRWTATKR